MMITPHSLLPTLLVTPAKAAISAEGGLLDILVRVQAPPQPPITRERPPLHLALVIDRSGSMAGQPLQEAVHCAEFIVTHLTPRDRAAIVVYDTKIDTLVPLTPTVDTTPFVQALRTVRDGGSTALHGGWLEGAKLLAPQVNSGALSRVLLLSDGQANVGVTDTTEIANQCKQLASAGVSTTTIGLGRSFNEELMVAMARQGGGEHYYGQRAADLEDAFREELALVQSLYARQGSASLTAGAGVIVEVLSVPGTNAGSLVGLSDLAYGAEVWLLLRLHYTPKSIGSHSLLSIVVKGQCIDGGTFEVGPTILKLPAIPAIAWNALPSDERVIRRRTEVETANLYDGVRAALKRQDRVEAQRLAKHARKQAEGNEWMEQSTAALERLVEEDEAMAEKEALFQSSKMRSRQAAPDEVASPAAAPSAETPAYLRRKTESGKRE